MEINTDHSKRAEADAFKARAADRTGDDTSALGRIVYNAP